MLPFYRLNATVPEPFSKDLDLIYKKLKFISGQFEVKEVDILSSALLLFFNQRKIKVLSCVLWRWDLENYHDIHTDGNYFSDIKRSCGINWNFSPSTSVKFYSEDNGRPQLKNGNQENFSTSWIYDSEPPCTHEWTGEGPVLFNPQVPHRIHKIHDSEKIRESLTLRLDESYESLYLKLQDLIEDK
jgi:hypothetical protein